MSTAPDADRRESFLAAIVAGTADLTPRLVYADWLEEFGSEDDRLTAEFIRVGIALDATGLTDCPKKVNRKSRRTLFGRPFVWRVRCGRCQFCRLRRRAQELMNTGHHTSAIPGPHGMTVESPPSERPASETAPVCYFRRGFVEVIDLAPAVWFEAAAILLPRAPLREVRFVVMPDLEGEERRYWQEKAWQAGVSLREPGLSADEDSCDLLEDLLRKLHPNGHIHYCLPDGSIIGPDDIRARPPAAAPAGRAARAVGRPRG